MQGAALVTKPPKDGKTLALYDGHCRFCTRQTKALHCAALGRIAIRSFQEPGALEEFPGLTLADCMRELKVVEPDGRVFGGAEAVARVVMASRPTLGKFASLYYLPGLRALADSLYRGIARNRYRLFGKNESCADDACAVHFDN